MIPICHVQVLPILSGVQRSMLETLRFLDRSIFEPHVICQGTGELTDELARREIPFHVVPEMQRWMSPWNDAAAYRAIKKLFKRHQFQLVHNQSAKPRGIGTFAARHAGVPVVVNHIRGYPFLSKSSGVSTFVYQKVEAKVAKMADRTISVNDEDRLLAVEKKLAPQDRIETIYNGADLELLDPTGSNTVRENFRRNHGLSDDEVAITFLARLDPIKRPLLLPKIAAELKKLKTSRPWKILVAGDGEMEDELTQAIASENVGDSVKMIGWQESPAQAFHGSDIILMTSFSEGLPRTLIEAHAAGVPCVGNDTRGIREVISNETGKLIPNNDPAEYATAIAEMVDNSLLRHRMGLAARKRAEEHFDTVKNNHRIIDIYCDLLDVSQSTAESSVHAA